MKQTGVRLNRGKNTRGFTLIEVLVVVAIIALLIAILLPSLKRARENARSSVCRTNLHDLGTSLYMYANTYKDWFPPTPYVGSKWRGSTVGAAVVNDDNLFILWYSKFATNVKIFNCPSTNYILREPSRQHTTRVDSDQGIYPGGYYLEVRTVIDGVPQLRNDFARAAQLKGREGFGSSYEYGNWISSYKPESSRVDWFHSRINRITPQSTALDEYDGDFQAPWTIPFETDTDSASIYRGKQFGRVVKRPTSKFPQASISMLMHDADESGEIIGGPPDPPGAKNNTPEDWDNHGKAGLNILFVDGHVDFANAKTAKRIWRQQVIPPN